MTKVSTELAAEAKRSEEFNASACLHCGTCTAVCPMGRQMLPRKLFRYVLLGMEEKVNESIPEIYSCLLCKMCEENCPADVNIAENMRTLRKMINRKEYNLPA